MIHVGWGTIIACAGCFALGYVVANRRWNNWLRDINNLDHRSILSLVHMWGPRGIYGRGRWPNP